MSHEIVVLPGDGIGPEIIKPAEQVLGRVGDFSFEHFPFGGEAIDLSDDPFPESTERACCQAGAVLLGAVGGPRWSSADPAAPRPEQGLLRLRKAMQTHANLRPVKILPSLAKSNQIIQPSRLENVDLVVVRELLGGIYFSERVMREGKTIYQYEYDPELVVNIGRTAFELAIARGEEFGESPSLLNVDKSNVIPASEDWRKIIDHLHSSEFEEVDLEHMYVDNSAFQIIAEAKRIRTVVTDNVFGDILSDEAALLLGSLGLAPSASLNQAGQGIFEPVHGSAPDIAGQGIANPIATILSGALLIDHCYGMKDEALAIEQAIDATLAKGIKTRDIGGDANTCEFTDQVLRRLDYS